VLLNALTVLEDKDDPIPIFVLVLSKAVTILTVQLISFAWRFQFFQGMFGILNNKIPDVPMRKHAFNLMGVLLASFPVEKFSCFQCFMTNRTFWPLKTTMDQTDGFLFPIKTRSVASQNFSELRYANRQPTRSHRRT
jgi:hypothetical protein